MRTNIVGTVTAVELYEDKEWKVVRGWSTTWPVGIKLTLHTSDGPVFAKTQIGQYSISHTSPSEGYYLSNTTWAELPEGEVTRSDSPLFPTAVYLFFPKPTLKILVGDTLLLRASVMEHYSKAERYYRTANRSCQRTQDMAM